MKLRKCFLIGARRFMDFMLELCGTDPDCTREGAVCTLAGEGFLPSFAV